MTTPDSVSSISYIGNQRRTQRLDAGSRALWRGVLRVLEYVLLLLTGLAMAIAFDAGHYLPTRISVALLFLLGAIGVARSRFAPFSPLTRLMLALYVTPFAVCYGYLFTEHYLWWDAPLAVAYMSDPVTVQIMTMTELIGLFGLLTGYIFAAGRHVTSEEAPITTRTLKPLPFLGTVLVALLFTWIATPSETIFSSLYTAAAGIAGRINFNAANLVCFTLLMLLMIDAEQERQRPATRRWKRATVMAVTLFILVVFQVLRGQRDSFGYLIGLAAIFLTEPMPRQVARRALRRRFAVLAVVGMVVLVVFLAVGDIRNRLALHESIPFGTAVVRGITEGFTGTGVLLTNLSLAHAYRVGDMTVEAGRTYVDYLRSLPPGFVTFALGIERPIEVYRGPNFWFTDISAGGVHVVTVPFKNFLAPGAFLVMIVYGYLITRTEVLGQRSRWLRRFWYGAMFVSSARWFWYGDIFLIREVMIFAIAAVLYGVTRRIGAFSLAAEEHSRS